MWILGLKGLMYGVRSLLFYYSSENTHSSSEGSAAIIVQSSLDSRHISQCSSVPFAVDHRGRFISPAPDVWWFLYMYHSTSARLDSEYGCFYSTD